MKETLQAINHMQADGVIGKYAIGGAVGATLYLEPAATLDIDIFVVLPTAERSSLVSLTKIYDYLKAKGGKVTREYIEIGGWPIQFLPPANELEREAVASAVRATVEDVPTWVMSAEHLVAIALQTGRSKDHIRILQFLEQGVVSRKKLEDILQRHRLNSKWRQFQERYLEGTHG
ncbi:MAG TPA: hypothetical protein VND65_17640 [Candidatus Binatia bacterium]|nr:hypothetical protein [Candidatus Binatia bacterium]